jgi:hypothetical protein
MNTSVIRKLRDLEQFARSQSVSPYNNSGKERHVRELFLEIANKLNGIIEKETQPGQCAEQVAVTNAGRSYADLGAGQQAALGDRLAKASEVVPLTWPSRDDLDKLVAMFNDHQQKLRDLDMRITVLESK